MFKKIGAYPAAASAAGISRQVSLRCKPVVPNIRMHIPHDRHDRAGGCFHLPDGGYGLLNGSTG